MYSKRPFPQRPPCPPLAAAETLLLVPSVVVPLALAPERDVLINHRAAGATMIRIVSITPFTLDPRLFRP